ncbi:MAG TPA: trypsin-like serine protease [Gaiellaceae bacterium]|nr:trypsin-like serine protease [Gaiellaceae bacterium]
MRNLFRLTGLLSLVVAVGLALAVPQARAIWDAGSADNNAHPMVGVLFVNDRPITTPAVFCSGTLISAHEFLTAAHCTQVLSEARMSHYRVTFDEQLSFSSDLVVQASTSIAVTGWVTHPGFHTPPTATQPGANDVGVIHLDPAVDVDATPVELPEVGFLDEQAAHNGLKGHEFTNVGYGVYSDFFTLGPSRRVSITPFVALSSYSLDQMGGNTAGDSGGPHFYGGDYPNLEVATTSTGVANHYNSSQRLDTQSVHTFLEPFTH